jgi:ABC-2 type transport system permease protein
VIILKLIKIIKNTLTTFNHYTFLLQQLVIRDFKVKYKRSVLGVLWSVLNPLFTMIILYVVFSTFFKVRSPSIPEYSVYLLTGLVFFNYFSEATSLSLGAIINNFNLITKVYMPKYIFPLSKVLSSAINLLFSLVAMYLIVFVQVINGKVPLNWTNLLLPYDIVCIIIFAVGMGLILSCLTVFFRDMIYIWSVILTAWMYFTPIMYALDMVENSKWTYAKDLLILMKINPLYQYINYARTLILFGHVPTATQSLMILACSLVSLALGLLIFRHNQDKFIYYI